MKKGLFSLVLVGTTLFVECSIDAERFLEREEASEAEQSKECSSCIAKDNLRIEICANGDGTYDLTHDTKTATLSQNELEGLSPKEFVQIGCKLDRVIF